MFIPQKPYATISVGLFSNPNSFALHAEFNISSW